MVLHFLGGFWQGLLFIWFFSIKDLPLLKPSLDPHDKNLISKAIFYVFIIGVSWELFQFYAKNYIGLFPFDIVDTTSDIFFDLAGGALAILYYFKTIMISKKNKVELG